MQPATPTPTKLRTPKQITLYIVGHNMAGNLPDADNYLVRTQRDAITASYTDARIDQQCLNEGLERPYVAAYTYRLSGRRGDYWLRARQGADYHYWYTPSVFTRYPTLAHANADNLPYVSYADVECCDMCDSLIAHDEPVYVDGNDYTVHADCALGRR